MKKLFLLFCLLFSFGLSFAQTDNELTPEEKERRERNIQAGNPFKKYGYTPKIATLSKGKYLEWHDLDSIVRIGSYSFHVKKKDIDGYALYEDKNSEATLRPELTSRWISPDPLAEEFPSWSPYVMNFNNPIRYVDPDGRAPVDWIKSNLTGKFEWRNEVTSASNTPHNYTYVGKTDESIVTNLFGQSNFKTSDWDVGLIGVNDFNNPYSAKGAAFNNMSANTTMSVSLRADVSTTSNGDGTVSKEFNGIDVGVSVSGKVSAPYPGVNIKLGGREITLGGESMNVHTPSPFGEFIQGGDVPTLTYDGFLSAQSIQSQFRNPTNTDVNFKGQYSNNGMPMSYPGASGLLGIPNPTKLNATLPLNNTANPYEIDRTNN
jgi:hypothetical protein